MSLSRQVHLTWILGSSPRMTRKRISQDDNTYSPRMTKRNGQDSPQDDRKYGRESINPRDDHPAGLSPTKIVIFAGPICRHPYAEGNLAFVSSRNKFPSIGEGDTGPRATRRVGGQDRGGKRVRNWILSLLSPRGLTTGPRSLKSRATRGQIYDDHIFYIPHTLNLNLLTQINLYTWILGSSPRMTKRKNVTG